MPSNNGKCCRTMVNAVKQCALKYLDVLNIHILIEAENAEINKYTFSLFKLNLL